MSIGSHSGGGEKAEAELKTFAMTKVRTVNAVVSIDLKFNLIAFMDNYCTGFE
jgi:hypothetical protein